MKKLASNLRESARFNQQVSDSGSIQIYWRLFAEVFGDSGAT
jgi:hypothetical protein